MVSMLLMDAECEISLGTTGATILSRARRYSSADSAIFCITPKMRVWPYLRGNAGCSTCG
jgi:hypothetical protein